jgi:antirestriction protein ArdC
MPQAGSTSEAQYFPNIKKKHNKPWASHVFGAGLLRNTRGRRTIGYYNIKTDRIHMPPIGTFHQAAGYYGTLAHELTHWTGATKRLDRLGRFNDRKAYASMLLQIDKNPTSQPMRQKWWFSPVTETYEFWPVHVRSTCSLKSFGI